MEKIAYEREQCLAKIGRVFRAPKNTVVRKSTGINYKNIIINKVNLGYLEMAEAF